MNKTEINKKQFSIYMIFAFGLAWILEIVASIASDIGETLFTVLATVAMYMPFVAVLIARKSLKGMGWIPHLKGKIKYIFFALWIPAVLSMIGGGLFFAIFPHTFDSEFQVLHNNLKEAGMLEQIESQGITMPMYTIITAIMAVTYVPFINMFVALGEEAGWRGFMYPYLKEKLGVNKGRIVGGLLWGAWHWPIMILAGYEYGKDYIGAPVLGLIVFCICTTAMGILFDYVYEKTETIWLPSLMHGATNAFTVFAYMIKPEYSRMSILGPAFIGIIGMIPMVVLAVIICIKQKKQVSTNE